LEIGIDGVEGLLMFKMRKYLEFLKLTKKNSCFFFQSFSLQSIKLFTNIEHTYKYWARYTDSDCWLIELLNKSGKSLLMIDCAT
jgi:hypothetical protein